MTSRFALMLAIASCAPQPIAVTPDHPAHPNAPGGRLAGPPAALSPDVAPTAPDTKPPPDAKPPPEPPKPDPDKRAAELAAAELAAYDKAKPVFEANCARCHSKGGRLATEKKRGHFDMTTYPFGGHHAATIAAEIRKALGIDGSKPTMPFDNKGAVKGADLALIAAWADAFDAAHKDAAHGHHGH